MERIAYYPRSDVRRAFGDRRVVTLDDLLDLGELRFAPRDELERDRSAVQPVAIAAIVSHDLTSVLTVTKTARATRATVAEQGRSLLYVGGHVDQVDSRGGSSASETLEVARTRELTEETTGAVLSPIVTVPPFAIWDRQGPGRSPQHLGVVRIMATDFTSHPIAMRGHEFGPGAARVMKVEDLDTSQMEAWSAAILDVLKAESVRRRIASI